VCRGSVGGGGGWGVFGGLLGCFWRVFEGGLAAVGVSGVGLWGC